MKKQKETIGVIAVPNGSLNNFNKWLQKQKGIQFDGTDFNVKNPKQHRLFYYIDNYKSLFAFIKRFPGKIVDGNYGFNNNGNPLPIWNLKKHQQAFKLAKKFNSFGK